LAYERRNGAITMNEVLRMIQKIGIVPVVVVNDPEEAVPLAKALCEGGLPCAEVTFRTAAAKEAIARMTKEFPQMLVGAGTVLTTAQVDEAVEAGAKFIVSPGLNPKVVRYCLEKNIPITPGTANASDIEQAIELGLDVVKFFPAEANGGLPVIKALAAPYVNMMFMPTGGINAKNINTYLAFPKILACGGSWMVNQEYIKNKEFDKIRELTHEAVMTMLGFEMKHVGINCEEDGEAVAAASEFEQVFGFGVNESGDADSVLAGRKKITGHKGYLVIGTNHAERAKYYLESQGMVFDEATAVYKDNRLKTIYMQQEISGFAVQLAEK